MSGKQGGNSGEPTSVPLPSSSAPNNATSKGKEHMVPGDKLNLGTIRNAIDDISTDTDREREIRDRTFQRAFELGRAEQSQSNQQPPYFQPPSSYAPPYPSSYAPTYPSQYAPFYPPSYPTSYPPYYPGPDWNGQPYWSPPPPSYWHPQYQYPQEYAHHKPQPPPNNVPQPQTAPPGPARPGQTQRPMQNPPQDNRSIKRKNLVGTVEKSVGTLSTKNRLDWFTRFLLTVRANGYEDHVNMFAKELIDGPESEMLREALKECTQTVDHQTVNEWWTPTSVVFHNLKRRYEKVQPAVVDSYQNKWDAFSFDATTDRIRYKLAELTDLSHKILTARPELQNSYCYRAAVCRLNRQLPAEYNNIRQMYSPHTDQQVRLDEFIDKLELHEHQLLGVPDESHDENAHPSRIGVQRGRHRNKKQLPARNVAGSRRQNTSPSSSPSPVRKKEKRKDKNDKRATRKCYVCKSNEHFAKNCPFKGVHDHFQSKLKELAEAMPKKKSKRTEKGFNAEDTDDSEEMPYVSDGEYSDDDDDDDKDTKSNDESGYFANLSDDENDNVADFGAGETYNEEGDLMAYSNTLGNQKGLLREWLIDSGASSHMTGRRDLFQDRIRPVCHRPHL